MATTASRVTVHAASLDGFIARKDGRVDWLETSDEFAGGESRSPESVEAFLKTIDCYVMGSRIYETALDSKREGSGGPTVTSPNLHSHDAQPAEDTRYRREFVNGRLRPKIRSIWFVGGGAVCGECVRRGLADEIRYSILPMPATSRRYTAGSAAVQDTPHR